MRPIRTHKAKTPRRPLVRVASLLALLALAAALTAYRGNTAAASVSKNRSFTIALLSQGPTNGWATQFDAIARATARAHAAEIRQLLYFDSHANADKQINDMTDAIAQHPDAIVLTPMGKAALAGPVNRAEARGIPVILCASGVTSNTYHALVFHDLMRAGEQDATWLAQKLHGRGNVAILDGIAGNDTSETLGRAVRAVLKHYPGIKIVAQAYTSFSVSQAKQVTDTFIASGKKIDGLWGSGGEAVTGAMEAYADAGKPMPLMAGTTAENGALRLAVQYHAQVAGFQFPAAISNACLTVALRVLHGATMHHQFIDISAVLPRDLTRDFFTVDLGHFYRPRYSDDYIFGTDRFLSKSELARLNLIKH
jgi:ribose transport system substrate-binding protein